ncbi:hypothetical protein L1887_38414 [Cichorium endivia]|nr:hypothetical protein L1887_38414 [Cichorium endivia]
MPILFSANYIEYDSNGFLVHHRDYNDGCEEFNKRRLRCESSCWPDIDKSKNVMKKQEELPICREGDLIMDQLVELTSKGCGCLLVIDDSYHLIGTFTDGDLWRTLRVCLDKLL